MKPAQGVISLGEEWAAPAGSVSHEQDRVADPRPDAHGESLSPPPLSCYLESNQAFAQPSSDETVRSEGASMAAWIAEALSQERLAIMEEMQRRHSDLLLKLDFNGPAEQMPDNGSPSVPFQQPMDPVSERGPVSSDVEANDDTEAIMGAGPSVTFQEPKDLCSERGPVPSDVKANKDTEKAVCESVSLESTNSAGFSRMITPSQEKSSFRTLRGIQRHHTDLTMLDEAQGLEHAIILLRLAVYGSRFELFFAALIILNAVAISVRAQYLSFDVAHNLGHRGSASSKDVWPWAEAGLEVVEYFFGIAFTSELVIKFGVGPKKFFRSAWHYFDALIVGAWLVSVLHATGESANTTVLRLVRLVRLFRLLRLVKLFKMFDVLHVLISSLKASLSVLTWTLIILVLLVIAIALGLNFSVQDYLVDESRPLDQRMEVFQAFGSFSRAVVSVFELTLGNWIVPLRVLHDNVSEWYGPVLIIYMLTVTFAIVQVIRAVFTQQTFKAADSDEELIIMQQERQMMNHVTNMFRLMREGDESGDGFLSLDEFVGITGDHRVKSWLAAMDLDASNAKLIFELIDVKHTNELSVEQLVRGVAKLKGTARSLDLARLHNSFVTMERTCKRLELSMLS